MDPFVIRLDHFQFAPKALERRGKLWGTVTQHLAGAEGRAGWLVQLAQPLSILQGWRPRRIEYLLISPRDPGDELTTSSYNLVVEIYYVLDPALVRSQQLGPEQAEYVALGHASAGITQ